VSAIPLQRWTDLSRSATLGVAQQLSEPVSGGVEPVFGQHLLGAGDQLDCH